MKKNFFISILILFFCIVLNLSNNAAAKVYVDIDSPSFKLIPIAICDFNNKTASLKKQADPGVTVSEGVKHDLFMTGIFNVLNKKSFLPFRTLISKAPSTILFWFRPNHLLTSLIMFECCLL